jgi:ribonuclease BN (tRNA processing enzyme)
VWNSHKAAKTQRRITYNKFTHFHVDHSADFPALIFSSWFEERDRPLPVYGPAGNSEFPSTVDFRARFLL